MQASVTNSSINLVSLLSEIEIDAKELRCVGKIRENGFCPNFQYFNPSLLIFQCMQHENSLISSDEDRTILRHRVRLLSRLNQFFVTVQGLPVTYDYFNEQGGVFTRTCPHRFGLMMTIRDLYTDQTEPWQALVRAAQIGPFILERILTLAEYHLWKSIPPSDESLPASPIKETLSRNHNADVRIRESAKKVLASYGAILTVLCDMDYHLSRGIVKTKHEAIWNCGEFCQDLMTQASEFVYECYYNPLSTIDMVKFGAQGPFLPPELQNEVRAQIAKRKGEEISPNT
jgi:hypothetical protein